MDAPMLARLILLALPLALAAVPAPARAEAEGPAAVDPLTQARLEAEARVRDEAQLGDYVPPPFERRAEPTLDEVRGKPVRVPVPGLDGVVRHKPGAGVWVGETPVGGDVFVKGGRSKVSVDWKLGF
ncbi:MAG: hypothetical protein JWN93_2221 [Hyphomicrobiales bacterium]|nr:hypothetical protein [Hyphomicrobiales bacterium]